MKPIPPSVHILHGGHDGKGDGFFFFQTTAAAPWRPCPRLPGIAGAPSENLRRRRPCKPTDFFASGAYTDGCPAGKAWGGGFLEQLVKVAAVSFLVNGLLLLGTARLAGRRIPPLRWLAAGLLGAAHGAGCLVPGFGFLGGLHWRLVSLGLMGILAFGPDGKLCCIYAVLTMALDGAALAAGRGGLWQLPLYEVGGSLQNAVVSALCTGSAALQDGAGIGDGGGNEQLLNIHLVIVLGIGNRTLEELEHGLRGCLGGAHDISACGLNILATDEVAEDRDLARRNTQVFQMCFCFHISSPLLRIGGLGTGVTTERSGRNELTQLMTNHVFCHIDGNMLAAVMDSDRMTNEGGENGRRSGPGLQHFLIAVLVELFDALVELRSNKRAFLNASAHSSFPPYLLLRRLIMNLSVRFLVLRVL